MLNLDAEGSDLVLPQLYVPGIIDSPWKVLPFWYEWGEWMGRGWGEAEGGMGGGIVTGM